MKLFVIITVKSYLVKDNYLMKSLKIKFLGWTKLRKNKLKLIR